MKLSKPQLEALLKMAAKQLKMSETELVDKLQNRDFDSLLKGNQSKQVEAILKDKKAIDDLLGSDAAKEIMKKHKGT